MELLEETELELDDELEELEELDEDVLIVEELLELDVVPSKVHSNIISST